MVRSLTKNKGKTSSEVEPDTEPLQLQTFADVQAFLLSKDELDKESDEEEVLDAGEDMDEDPQEEAEKIGLDPKKIISAKAGEKFKKAHDAEHQVLKREHSQKAKRAMKLIMKRVERYMWTMSNRLKPKPITDIKIHPNTKPTVLTVYRNNDKIKFKVHSPFKFGDFGITEQDELVCLPALVPGQLASQSQEKEEILKKEEETHGTGLECNRSHPDGVPFVNNMVIKEPEYRIFFTGVLGNQAFQRWNGIYKIGVDYLVSYLVMDLMVKTQENVRSLSEQSLGELPSGCSA
ncbi:hypothetical protein Tco_0587015 [Tanacetum coccineum]